MVTKGTEEVKKDVVLSPADEHRRCSNSVDKCVVVLRREMQMQVLDRQDKL